MVDGININQEDADQEYLPDDLNSLAVGSYVVPNPSKRKVYPALSFIVGLIFLAASYFTVNGRSTKKHVCCWQTFWLQLTDNMTKLL